MSDVVKRLKQIEAAAQRIKDYPNRSESEADFIRRLVENALSHLRTEPASPSQEADRG